MPSAPSPAASEPLPPEAPPPSVRPTLGTRLWFAWAVLVALVVTVPLSLLQVVTHAFDPTARNFKRWAGLWGRMILRGSGIRVTVEGALPDPARPCVFVANHQNALDVPVLAGYLPAPFGFVAKAELARVPFLGFAIRQSASLFIDRSEPRRSLASIQRAGERIRGGNSVLIFPEGRRTWSGRLDAFMKGAFILAVEAGVPLVPVTLVDAYRLLDERHGAARPGRVHVVLGTPIDLAGKRRRDVLALMAAVREEMERTLAARNSADAVV
ncbi:MAG: lysophospholipid acyltransferase family protein [Rhodothermales bacterium]|nr:lysophospholipid acyltransferase family protein [Rhodothermales bacterium]